MVSLIRRFLRPYHRSLLIVVALLLLQAVGTLFLPMLNADIINDGVVKGDISVVLSTGSAMLAVSVLVGVVSIVATYYAARTATGFGRDMRRSLFRNVQRFSLAEMNEFGAPSLITRNTNDVQQVQMLVLTGQTMMVSAPLMALGGVFMALRMNVQLSALLFVIIPVMAVVIGLILRQAVPLFRAMQGKLDTINDVLRENLTGIRVIRAFVKTDYEQQRFERANADLTDVTLRVTRLFALMMPSVMLVFNLSSVAIIWFGGHLVGDGQMQIGDLTAFLAYIMQILFSVMMAVMLMMMVPRASASAERIEAVLATRPAITDPLEPTVPGAMTSAGTSAVGTGSMGTGSAGTGSVGTGSVGTGSVGAGSVGTGSVGTGSVGAGSVGTGPASASQGSVEFRGVEFRYRGAQEPVLCNVNLTIQPGQTTAIVGSTGSGKSTLVSLIPRLFDVTSGSVLVNGVDVRQQEQESLWRSMSFVPQKAFLFSGTIGSNVRFGRPEADEQQVRNALQIAQATAFVEDLPDGLDAPIDQGGANVSGGQRQRLAIARAIVRRPDIYVFDDSFSALDFATDAKLRVSLGREVPDATVIVVAQRVSTILNADQIVVLERGRIVGSGTHAYLIEECETYREIVFSQMREDEVP